jgi:hypothetical protein
MHHRKERLGHGEVIAVDRNYVPMQEITRRKAICAVAAGRAHVLEPDTFDRHDEVGGRIRLVIFPHAQACPEAKLLSGRLERRVLKRDGHVCQYVGCDRRATTVDHVVPLCQGGQTTWINLVACCLPCNQGKGGRTPQEAGMVLKKVPKGPRALLFERFEQIIRDGSAA